MTDEDDKPSAIERRHEPEADLVAAEKALFEEMEAALHLMRSGDDFGRAAARHALYACYSFLHVRGLPGRDLAPLLNVIQALDDVSRSIVPELFDPKADEGGAPERKWSRSTAARKTRIYAAACMEALMRTRTGGRKTPAAREVARSAEGWPRISKGIIKESTVTNWRDYFLQAEADDPDRMMFEKLAAVCSEGPRANQFLDELLKDGPFVGGITMSPPSET